MKNRISRIILNYLVYFQYSFKKLIFELLKKFSMLLTIVGERMILHCLWDDDIY